MLESSSLRFFRQPSNMAFATEAQNGERASSGQKRKAADDLSQEEQCRKEEHSARDMWTLRQAERIIHLYNQLGSRWKRSVSRTAAFLRLLLHCSLDGIHCAALLHTSEPHRQ
jgi:hypothetical protein